MLPIFKYLILFFYIFIFGLIGMVIDIYMKTDLFKYIGILVGSYLFYQKKQI